MPGGKSPGYANLLPAGILAGFQLFDLARGAPDELRKLQENPDKDAASPDMERAADWGDRIRHALGFGTQSPSASDKWLHPDDDRLSRARAFDAPALVPIKWSAPSSYDREARARARGLTYDAPNTDGNALHRNDETPVASLPAHELFQTVREGSKEGIVQGLRELAQQQELGGNVAGDLFGVKSSSGGLGGSGRHFGGGAPFAGASIGDHARGGIGHGAAAMAPGARESFDFWKSKGLTSEQAAGLVGMEQGESQFNPRAVGDGGQAHGAFQWHAPRRAAILHAIGIDIDRATHRQQLEAAYWEFTQGNDPQARAAWDAVKRGKSATDAARSGVYLFERPADRQGQSIVRGGMAEGWLKRFNEEDSKTKPPAGAGLPAPSAKAIGDAEVMAARQRIINGSTNPADRALIEHYKQQQNAPKQPAPQAHARGGPIRGPGTGTSDSIPAMLSNGEYVVRASAAGRFLPLLHAINRGDLSHFADGGAVGKPLTIRPKAWVPPVGFGVDKRFYPKWTPAISAAEGAANRRSWRDFFRRPTKDGGMGASWRTTFGTMAMLAGESGYGLNSKTYGWDVNGPSGGVEQWHDVTVGKWTGRLHRLSDLMTFAMRQHADWTDPAIQQAFKKHEDTTSFLGPWRRMLAAKTARGALKEGIDHVEIPANKDLELVRRLPNIVKMQREAMSDGAVARHEVDPVEVNIRHHPHTGRPIVTARAGKGVKLGIKTMPTMRPT